jgi:hypothetical protein
LDLSRSIAEQFHDIDGLDDGVGHRVNTIPGSMRVTCTIAPIADMTHMTTVNRNSPGEIARVGTALMGLILRFRSSLASR